MSIPTTPESALQKEWRLFKEGFARLINAYLNMMFDLSPKASRGRFWAFLILFFLTIFMLSLINYPLNLWMGRVQDIFLYTFNSAYRAAYTAGDPVSNLILFAVQVFLDPRNLRFFPLLLAPYFISLQSAAIYLADIFNPEKVPVYVARKHILEVALGGSDETIRISKGEIAEEFEKSANYLIGGPGKVIVDLDSVALFEKPDGTPHVIGPTGREPGGKASIEGFERFREAIDLRDHFIELRDLDEKASSISSRSKDGVPISATDVRFMFSVDRDQESKDMPYSFSRQAVENLVYRAMSKVTPEREDPSSYVFLWRQNMISLIRGELAKFMSKHDLNKYLASIGLPEEDRTARRETMLTDEARSLLPSDMQAPEKKDMPKKPDFIPRPQIKTDLFSEFAESFNKNSRDRGVKLHWIGIGTWESPINKVFGKHIEAWKISWESAKLDGDEPLKKFGIDTALQKMVELIQEIPIESYQLARAETSNSKAIKNKMFVSYRNQLVQAKDLWESKGELVPVDVEDAIKILFDVFGHPIGGEHTSDQNPEPPDDGGVNDGQNEPSIAPGFTYEYLIGMVGGDGAEANRLIEHERGQFPNETQDRLIARAIDRLIKDRM